MSTPADDYAWLQDPRRCRVAVAGCVTVVKGGSVDEVLAAFGADPAVDGRPWDESASVGDCVAVVTVDGGVLAVEDNGWQGSRPEVLRRLARLGRAASTFWNVNALTRVSAAEGGRLLGAFDPVAPDQLAGDDPEAIAKYLAGLDFEAGSWVAQGMVVVERFTGVRVTEDTVAALDHFHTLTPWLEDLRPADAAYHPLRWVDAELLNLVARQPASTLRRLAAWAATESVRAAGLADHPDFRDVLDTFARGGTPTLSPAATETVRQLDAEGARAGQHDSAGANPATRQAWKRAAAAQALRAATNDDPLAAALDAIQTGRLALPDLGADLLRGARDQLA